MSKLQAMAMPQMLRGNGNIGLIGSCGSGKTLAYAIGVLNNVKPDEQNVQVLVLCANYEAAVQTGTVFTKLAMYTKIKIGVVVQSPKGT